jgi:Fe-S-cluster containining protein
MYEDAAKKTCSFDVCSDCIKGCCQDAMPPLTSKRIRLIAKYLKRNGGFAEQMLTHSAYSFPSVDSKGFCVFHEKQTKKCLIHDVKPETCRAGPVTFDIDSRTKKVEWFLKKGEVCRLAGRLFENPQTFKEHFKVARQEIMRLIRELDSAQLRAILERDEPQTLKIGEDVLPQEVVSKLNLE